MTTALIDADIVAFRAAAGSTQTVDWSDEQDGSTVAASSDPQSAVDRAMEIVREWREAARCDDAIVCWSDPAPRSSFRYAVFPGYKAKRKPGEKPEQYATVVEALNNEFESITLPRLEADDVLGIYSTRERDKYVAVSMDKDMLTLPARVLVIGKGTRPSLITPRAAFTAWMRQTLTGDPVDGYPGCPGAGPKRFEKLEAEHGFDQQALWKAIVAEYEKKGRTLDDAVANARCARILRTHDYNPETGAIRLWHPTSPTWSLPASSPSTPTA